MRSRTSSPGRILPDGTPLQNRLLASLPTIEYDRIARHLRLESAVLSDPLHDHGRRIDHVYFPNGGVFSITNRMRDGALVEVAMVGREGMLGIGVFLGDRSATGRTFLQVADGPVAALTVARFVEETAATAAFGRSSGGTHKRACCRRCSAPPATPCTTRRNAAAAGCCRRTTASTGMTSR